MKPCRKNAATGKVISSSGITTNVWEILVPGLVFLLRKRMDIASLLRFHHSLPILAEPSYCSYPDSSGHDTLVRVAGGVSITAVSLLA